MINIDEWTITRAVLAAQDECPDPRLKEVIESLVKSLHAFARDVRLTDEEWFAGIKFLTELGHITGEKRQEFIRLSDILGLSTLVTAQNHWSPSGHTESTVLGPFFIEGVPHYENGADISNGAAGQRCFVRGTVQGSRNEPVGGAEIAVWHADQDGLYDVQRAELSTSRGHGKLRSLEDGSYFFKSIVPSAHRIADDGPVRLLLEALGRHSWRPPHMHFMVNAPGYEKLITHAFRSSGPYLDSDPGFAVRSRLIADWVLHEPGMGPDGLLQDSPYCTLQFDLQLAELKV